MLAAAMEANSTKKPARASAKRLLWSATRTSARSPSTVPTPDVRTADVASFQRTPTTTARARPAEPNAAPGASPAAAATPRAPPAADAAARRMSFAPPSPATRAAKPQTHASATPTARPTPPRGAFPAPREANAERDTPVGAEQAAPEPPSSPGAAPVTAAGFGPQVVANPFAAAAEAAARRLDHAATKPAGTPEAPLVPRLGAARAPPVAPPRAPPSRVAGFVNLGNTCYLAATAQLLCGLDAFAGFVDGLPDAYVQGGLGAAPRAARPDASSPETAAGAPLSVTKSMRDLVRARAARAARFDDAVTRAAATEPMVPARLKGAVQRRHPRYEGYEQHDAHEFLCETLDAVAEEAEAAASRARETALAERDACFAAEKPIGGDGAAGTRPRRLSGVVPLHRTLCPTRRAFTGASAVTLTCETCGDASTTAESFRHLSLELPDAPGTRSTAPLELEALIARCFAPETVERRCARVGCGGTRATMARRLLRAPRVLLVHLKRFRAEDAARLARETRGAPGDAPGCSANAFALPRLTKDARPVELRETVTLAPFADAAVRGPPTSSRAGAAVSPAADSELPADEAEAATRAYDDDDSAEGEAARSQLASYRLAGVVSHLGTSMRRGHYVACARVASGGGDVNEPAANRKRWMSFDDERASFAGSPAAAASAPGDWYFAAFECEAAR